MEKGDTSGGLNEKNTINEKHKSLPISNHTIIQLGILLSLSLSNIYLPSLSSFRKADLLYAKIHLKPLCDQIIKKDDGKYKSCFPFQMNYRNSSASAEDN